MYAAETSQIIQIRMCAVSEHVFPSLQLRVDLNACNKPHHHCAMCSWAVGFMCSFCVWACNLWIGLVNLSGLCGWENEGGVICNCGKWLRCDSHSSPLPSKWLNALHFVWKAFPLLLRHVGSPCLSVDAELAGLCYVPGMELGVHVIELHFAWKSVIENVWEFPPLCL